MKLTCLVLTLAFYSAVFSQQPQLKIHLGHSAWIEDFAISRDEKYLATASMDNTVKIWDFRSKKELLTLKSFTNHAFTRVAFSPDNTKLVSGDEWGDIQLWNVATGNLIDTFTKFHWQGITSLSFSNNGQYIASAGNDSVVNVWEIKSGKELNNITLRSRAKKVKFLKGDSLFAFFKRQRHNRDLEYPGGFFCEIYRL